ncbi:MAG: hypothetical protein O3A26_02725 [Proteobacteria bacterium]|nr:hypothetical protein [Pseudomonadota bacterium]MDA0995787.1 hypothetical protein [Pseudomonadota bacterium]
MNTIAQTETVRLSFVSDKLTNILKTTASVLVTMMVLATFLCLPLIAYLVTRTGI